MSGTLPQVDYIMNYSSLCMTDRSTKSLYKILWKDIWVQNIWLTHGILEHDIFKLNISWPSINVAYNFNSMFCKCCCLDYAVSGNVIFPNNQRAQLVSKIGVSVAALHSFSDNLFIWRWTLAILYGCERKGCIFLLPWENNWQEVGWVQSKGNKLYFHLRRYVPSEH